MPCSIANESGFSEDLMTRIPGCNSTMISPSPVTVRLKLRVQDVSQSWIDQGGPSSSKKTLDPCSQVKKNTSPPHDEQCVGQVLVPHHSPWTMTTSQLSLSRNSYLPWGHAFLRSRSKASANTRRLRTTKPRNGEPPVVRKQRLSSAEEQLQVLDEPSFHRLLEVERTHYVLPLVEALATAPPDPHRVPLLQQLEGGV